MRQIEYIADSKKDRLGNFSRSLLFVEGCEPLFNKGKPEESRALLDDVWEAAERGPYPLFHADARNVLYQLERDAGNLPAAIEAATQAYRLAWCDGPPWAYHYGLENAKKHLQELGAPSPEMTSQEG